MGNRAHPFRKGFDKKNGGDPQYRNGLPAGYPNLGIPKEKKGYTEATVVHSGRRGRVLDEDITAGTITVDFYATGETEVLPRREVITQWRNT